MLVKINKEKFWELYSQAIWVTPVQCIECNTAYMTKIDHRSNLVANIIIKNNIGILFLGKLNNSKIKESIDRVIDEIKREHLINQIRIYLWDENDKAELYGAINDFEIVAKFRRYIKIDNEFFDILLAIRYFM